MKAADAMIRPLLTVGPQDFARHAEGLMDDSGLTMLPVVDGDVFVGVVTKAGCRRDGGQAPKVKHVMAQPALTAGPDFDLAALFEAMTRYEAISVPLVQDGRLVGVVTRLDVLRTLSHDDPHLRAGHAAEYR